MAVEVVRGDGLHGFLVDLDGDGMFSHLASYDGEIITSDGITPLELNGQYTLGDLEHMHEASIGIDGYSNPEVAQIEHGESFDASVDIFNTDGSQTETDDYLADNTIPDTSDDDTDSTTEDDLQELAINDSDESDAQPSDDEELSGEDVYAQLFGDDVDDSEEYLYDEVIISETEHAQTDELPDNESDALSEYAQNNINTESDSDLASNDTMDDCASEETASVDYAADTDNSTDSFDSFSQTDELASNDDPSFYDIMIDDLGDA